MAELIGIVEDIVFRNEDNGFSVVGIREEGTQLMVTCVGNFPFINQGERVRLEGEWTTHPDYGQQLKMVTYSSAAPTTIQGMESYLASGLIRGVGASTARKLVHHFGEDVLDIIQFNPQRLIEVDGIGESRAEMIASSFSEQKEIREVMIFLQSYGITTAYALKIFKTYGSNTINSVRENPYRLAEDIIGIGFKTADRIARAMGVDSNSPYRVAAGINYVLSQAASQGHAYLPEEELMKRANQLLIVEETLVKNGLINLTLSHKLVMEQKGDYTAVYLSGFFQAESGSAQILRDLALDQSIKQFSYIEDKIRRFEKDNKMILAEEQREAVRQAMQYGVIVITGGPGTGKTTIINCMIELFTHEGLKVELAAPTGRAAKRMAEAAHQEAKTIHRLLEYGYSEEHEDAFQRDEDNPIKADVVIIDEMSMVDVLLLYHLLKAIVKGTRLIMVGDVDQLPSVGPGNVLRDIIQSNVIPVIQLTEIFRQAQESMIIVNAHRINQGDMPLLNLKEKDFFIDKQSSAEDILKTLDELITARLPGYGNYRPLQDIQILAPMRKGLIGVNNLNKELQKVLNPPAPHKKEKASGDTIFRQGDKVMQIKNNYKLQWTIPGKDEDVFEGEGIFNGDMGFIQDIDKEEQTLTILFDDEKTVIYDFSQLDELELSYAVTIHKSQGSEFPVVVIPLAYGPPMLMTRNLLYTAVTRARELVVLVGKENMIRRMVENNHIARRYSSLDERLQQAYGMVTS
ncbi:MAG TPA: ATP-dependent RecD-like DNA helicase [Clostridiales bacterium]|nr:ATP-dependent RecD-like DNA helicase [Clostridiales bacterium]